MSNPLKRIQKEIFRSHVLDRLRADIGSFEIAFDRYKREADKASVKNGWIESCQAHLDHARAALEKRDVTAGYQSLLDAEREAIPGLPYEERLARVVSLEHESKTKLADSWRGVAVQKLIRGNPEEVPVDAIKEALFHLNTHSQNTYRKIDLLRHQTIVLALITFVLLLVAVLGAYSGQLDLLSRDRGAHLLPFAIYLGLLGGTLSAFISVTKSSHHARIPDVRRTRLITLARTMIGGAAAIPMFMLISGDLVKAPATTWALLLFCFLAGFSERWFLRSIQSFTSERRDDDRK